MIAFIEVDGDLEEVHIIPPGFDFAGVDWLEAVVKQIADCFDFGALKPTGTATLHPKLEDEEPMILSWSPDGVTLTDTDGRPIRAANPL